MTMLPRLTICSRNRHLLQTEEGNPFLILGDTAWELFHRLKLEEVQEYFEVRSSQGFNMVWANVLAEFDGLRSPNRYGVVPFTDTDPRQPVEAYFEFVDRVVDLAAAHGIYVGLLPTWGDKVTAPWGAGPAVFTLENLDVSFEYAQWLGRRYAAKSNVLWVLGGDRPARLFGEVDQFPKANALEAGLDLDSDWTPIWRKMAEGLRSGGANQLVTYHPQGGQFSTSVFLHDETWLDMNAMQSGHGGGHDVPVWESISRDYALTPVKPTFDAEPNYEDHPVNPWPVWDPKSGFFDDYDVRKQVYRSILAGGCGVVYGNHCVWQFASELFEPVLEVRMDWKRAVRQPGAEQMRNLCNLFRMVDFPAMVPDQSIVLSEVGMGPTHVRAMRSDREALIYVPDGREVELSVVWALGQDIYVSRYCPKDGVLERVECAEVAGALKVPAKPNGDQAILVRVISD